MDVLTATVKVTKKVTKETHKYTIRVSIKTKDFNQMLDTSDLEERHQYHCFQVDNVYLRRNAFAINLCGKHLINIYKFFRHQESFSSQKDIKEFNEKQDTYLNLLSSLGQATYPIKLFSSHTTEITRWYDSACINLVSKI